MAPGGKFLTKALGIESALNSAGYTPYGRDQSEPPSRKGNGKKSYAEKGKRPKSFVGNIQQTLSLLGEGPDRPKYNINGTRTYNPGRDQNNHGPSPIHHAPRYGQPQPPPYLPGGYPPPGYPPQGWHRQAGPYGPPPGAFPQQPRQARRRQSPSPPSLRGHNAGRRRSVPRNPSPAAASPVGSLRFPLDDEPPPVHRQGQRGRRVERNEPRRQQFPVDAESPSSEVVDDFDDDSDEPLLNPRGARGGQAARRQPLPRGRGRGVPPRDDVRPHYADAADYRRRRSPPQRVYSRRSSPGRAPPTLPRRGRSVRSSFAGAEYDGLGTSDRRRGDVRLTRPGPDHDFGISSSEFDSVDPDSDSELDSDMEDSSVEEMFPNGRRTSTGESIRPGIRGGRPEIRRIARPNSHAPRRGYRDDSY